MILDCSTDYDKVIKAYYSVKLNGTNSIAYTMSAKWSELLQQRS